MIQIIQHRIKCIGCNACVEAAPDRWRISRQDGKCTLIGAIDKKGILTVKVNNDEWEANQKAAFNCPVKIIQMKRL
jgi:ferredoxin